MLINPPFLPEPGHASIAQVDVDEQMQGGRHGQGAYPVSLNGWWHGGMHVTSSDTVRVIADGTVHYVRKPTPKPDQPNKNDPLYYNGGWTSNGVVVIQHHTEIGENTPLTWYSVYMHLKDIEAEVEKGKKVWRKGKLGEAGYIYGSPDLIHFEIVMDADNIQALIGRSPDTPLDTSKPGRTDAVWGECHVYLPAGTKVYTQDMREAQRKARHAAYRAQFPGQPHGESVAHSDQATTHYEQLQQAESSTLSQALIVGLDYHEGHCSLTSYTEPGDTLAAARHEGGHYEYDLYQEACELYPDGAEAGYQLLRFGRSLNGAILPDDTAHWRKVTLPDGTEGWVNLNAQGPDTPAFSDADFPPWKHWVFADDDTDGNIRCNSAKLRNLVLKEGDSTLPDDQFIPRLSIDAVRHKLDHAICKMPSDWDIRRREQVWHERKHEQDLEIGYLPPSAKEAEDKAWQRLSAHCEALCFWSKAGLPEPGWHLPPKAFIKQVQRCGWLSKDEMIQLFPRTAMRKSGARWVSENVHPGSRQLPIQDQYTDLNKACRHYGIVTPLRMAAFYANAMQETRWFQKLHENNSGERYWPWDGRGYMQLTWPHNYIKYWRFTGKDIDDGLAARLGTAQRTADATHSNAALEALETEVAAAHLDAWRDDVEGKEFIAADSAGVYWAWSHAAKYADTAPVNVRASKAATGPGSYVYYTSSGMGNVAATVNVGSPSTNYVRVNGIVARFQAYNNCEVVLLDVPAFPDSPNPGEPEGYRPRRP